MQRSNLIRWAALCLSGLITLIVTAGCGHPTPAAAPTPAPLTTAAAPSPAAPNAAPAAFQPYTLLPPPPPAPPVAAPRHRVLHLTRVHDRVYLTDSDRRLYEAGRDTQGHIYPVYRDPATRVTYPLYYDSSRDNLYRLARQEDGHFYRNYVGQPADRFYDTDRDYERIAPGDDDRPIVTDSYNTYNDNTYNEGPNSGSRPFYGAYRPPPAHHANHVNYNWLWAIPVIIGAYLLLQPHHHSPPQPVSARQNPVIVRRITTVNNTNITNTNITNVNIVNQITQAAPVGYRPIASPRPVYVSAPRYALSPIAARPVAWRPTVRSHGPIGPLTAAPVAAAVAGLVHSHPLPVTPAVRSVPVVQRPAALVRRPVSAAPHPARRPSASQARLLAPVSSPTRRIVVSRPHRFVLLSSGRPAARHVLPARPPMATPHRQVRLAERRRVISIERRRAISSAPPKLSPFQPRSVEHVPNTARPHPSRPASPATGPTVRPVVIVHPHPVPQPRREEAHPAPRVEQGIPRVEQGIPRVQHSAPRVEHPAPMPRRPEPARPVVRPRVVRLTSPAKAHPAEKRPEAPKKEDRPKDSGKPEHR